MPYTVKNSMVDHINIHFASKGQMVTKLGHLTGFIQQHEVIAFDEKNRLNSIKEALIMMVIFFILKARSLKTYIDNAILVAVEETPEEVGQLLQLEGRELLLEGGVVHSTPIWNNSGKVQENRCGKGKITPLLQRFREGGSNLIHFIGFPQDSNREW
jgi:hypothetical protein